MAIFDVPLADLRKRTSIKWRRFEPDVIPMFVAEMDAHMAAPIRERLERAIRDGDTGYPQDPCYQESYAAFAADTWGWTFNPDDAKLATDVVTGMRDALVAVSEPGDGVVINSPIYPPFRAVTTTTGRRLIDVPLRDGRLDLDGLEATFAEQSPTAYLLCSPHNPSGAIHTREELLRVGQLAERYGVTVIADEIHAPIAGADHIPYFDAAGSDNAVIVTSASKSWNLASLKSALVIGDRDILAKLDPMISDGASHFGVIAHCAALDDARAWLLSAAVEIDANKRFFAEQLSEHLPQLTYEPTPGTYLAWLDCSPLGLEHPGRHFHEKARVRFNFGPEFAPDATQFVRVNLATSREIIAEAVRRMATSLAD
ncbi:MAG TPA: aminotransferase class I/II-fold pyridoxal phosphate-dependent enzyme [Tessaracoccus flavescens]|uniref:cysteine-S-conjugate beta-lyase n=1 Tax=Tessaracoccus flavescens TaxID=399497 RepID=A0A921EPC4_9ACTN|nr:aminotransferase class I/II-fold pyridoxal phosphate-dependent enzyme [Tessaracoccus flavescens]